jgi:hypothetical protein
MHHAPLRALRGAVLAGAALAVLAVAPGAASAAHKGGHPSHPVLPTCAGKAAVKPSRFVVTCADAGVSATGLRWSRWTAREGVAKGTLVQNTCEPTCAAGRFTRTRVTVRVWRLRACPALQREIYTRIIFNTPRYDGEPYTLRCPKNA